jgi:hypothetical protein
MTLGALDNRLLDEIIRDSHSFRKNGVSPPGANLRLFANIPF